MFIAHFLHETHMFSAVNDHVEWDPTVGTKTG